MSCSIDRCSLSLSLSFPLSLSLSPSLSFAGCSRDENIYRTGNQSKIYQICFQYHSDFLWKATDFPSGNDFPEHQSNIFEHRSKIDRRIHRTSNEHPPTVYQIFSENPPELLSSIQRTCVGHLPSYVMMLCIFEYTFRVLKKNTILPSLQPACFGYMIACVQNNFGDRLRQPIIPFSHKAAPTRCALRATTTTRPH